MWDSKVVDEYQECLTKTKVLRPSTRDFDLLETMLWSPSYGYTLLDYHMKRLAQSADYFGFIVDIRRVQDELAKGVAGLIAGPHKLRLLVSRRGAVSCTVNPLEADAMSFDDLVLSKSPIDSGDVFLYHKTTNRRVYEDAVRLCEGCNDVLLLNEKGEITESTVANVAVEIDGEFCTPPVQCGLLPGTQRAWMLDHAQLQEKVISIEDVQSSPNIYLLNSIRGMHKVRVRLPGE